MTQLQTYYDNNGGDITLNGKTFAIEGIARDGDIAVATFVTKRAKYTGIWCTNTQVVGKPGAEVWSLLSVAGKEIATFAVYNGGIVALS